MKTVKLFLTLFLVSACLFSIMPGSAAASALEKKLVIYSTHPEALLELVADEFEKKTKVKVEFINLKGALVDRVRAEKSNPGADIMYGGPSSNYMELKAENIFAPFTPSWADKLDPMFKDTQGYWYGVIQTPVLMFYNTQMLSKEDLPSDWTDLADPKYKNLLVFRNALSTSARATYSALLQQFEKKGQLVQGWDFLKAVDTNTKRYYGSSSMIFQAIGRKEAAIGFMVLNSVIDNKIKNKMPIDVIDAKSGSPVLTDAIALIAGAKHPNAAKAFIEFAGSAQTQALLAHRFNRLPTHPDAIANSPAWMVETKFKAMNVDWGDLSKKQSAWIQKWDSQIKNSKKDQ